MSDKFRLIFKTIVFKLNNYPKIVFINDIKLLIIYLVYSVIYRNKKVDNINKLELRVYSQNGEDGIILSIFKKIGFTNNYYVEIGTEDGSECNTRFLKEFYNCRGLLVDGEHQNDDVKREFVTCENIQNIFRKYKVPINFDLLSIDIDGNDYWVWKAIKNYKPQVVVIEYNSAIKPPKSVAIKYNKNFKNKGDDYFGASLSALVKLARSKGYRLVACDNKGINAFFVQESQLKDYFKLRDYKEIYKPPKYGNKVNGKYVGYKKSSRLWEKV